MDYKIFDSAAIITGWAFFLDWLIGHMALLQSSMGLMVGLATFIYTVIRIVQALKK